MAKVKLPPTILIQEENFHNAWARAVRAILRDGKQMTIGDVSNPKPIRDACVLFELTGNAIGQIERRELHPQFPFRHVDHYCGEYTKEYLAEYVEKPENERFSYLYFERLAMYETGREVVDHIDQIQLLRQQLDIQKMTRISSNRNQAITWQVLTDAESASPPCLQRIQIRYLGNNNVGVHLTWRSRDLYTAWQANIIAVVDMLNREVIRPNGCRIIKLLDYNDSLHIYLSDGNAEKVKLLPVNPQARR